MTHENQFFIVDVMVIDLTRKMVATNVISRLTGVGVKLNAIVKICKYRGLYEKHHFISIAIEVHGAPKCDMDHFTR